MGLCVSYFLSEATLDSPPSYDRRRLLLDQEDDEAHIFLHPPAPPRPPSPMSRRHAADTASCGEIVEVQGGHIVRSTGRKDRLSKVFTAKGPRDRRVMLSCHTAIQFYDIQDRLGFDRPSKAVDWLIKKAKSSIDELAQLPPSPGSSTEAPPNQQIMHNNSFHHHPPDLLSRTNQDLRLSLHSFPDGPPSLLHNHHYSASAAVEQSNPLGYDHTSTGGGWEQQSIQRLVAWNSDTGNGNGEGNGGGFLSAPPPAPTSFQQVVGQSQLYSSQRGPLHSSSTTPMIRAWFDPHHHHPSISTDDLNHHIPPPVHQGEFSSGGFRIPARFQGQEEEQQHDGLTNKPSSASFSISRHH